MTAVRRDRSFSSAISRAMSRTHSTCGSPPAVPAEPISAGMFALLLATRTRVRSRLTASRGNAAVPEPSAKGPASVVPASEAMKCGRNSSDLLSASASTPTPRAPLAATYRISSKRILLLTMDYFLKNRPCATRARSEAFTQTDADCSWIVPVVDRHVASLVVFGDGIEEIGQVGIVYDRTLIVEVLRPKGRFGAIVIGRPRRMHIQHAVIRALGDDETRRIVGIVELDRTAVGDVGADANLARASRCPKMRFRAKIGRIARREGNGVARVIGRGCGRRVRDQVAAVFRIRVRVGKPESEPLDR